MIELPHRSPANISSAAAAPMPRWALPCLVGAFLLPGLFGRDLWPQDATGFARMWAMAQGGLADWLMPNVAGADATDGGPLPYWPGALLIRLAGRHIGDVNAAGLANLFWYPLALVALWLTLVRLARRDAAQPVAAAFGGEASRRSYARLIADVGVLLTIGTLGLIWRLHQTQPEGALLAIGAAAMLATSLIEWQLECAALLAGASAAALALSAGPVPALGLALGSAAVFLRGAPASGAGVARTIGAVLLILATAILPAAAWPLAARALYPREAATFFELWREHSALGFPGLEGCLWMARTSAWFLWPLWPLAAWAVYAWRASARAAHLERPLVILGGLVLATLYTPTLDERALAPLVAPLVVLAAFGATTLRRALDNAIDWFAMAMFSLILVFLWGYFLALQTGAPRPMAASLARLAPGYVAHLNVAALVLALLATAVWLRLIGWRVARRPRVLWRGPLLAACGVTAIWVGATLLFLPAVDYVYSYRAFAQDVAAQLQAQLQARGLAHGCVQSHRIALADRAVLAYYGHIRFDRDGSPESCPLALHHDSRRNALDDDPPPGVRGMWELAWEGHRKARPEERWRIWARAP